jgi:replicative DNA helicase
MPEYPDIQSLEAERAVIGAVLLDKSALPFVNDIVTPGDFYALANKTVMEAIIFLQDHGQPPDVVLVANELKARGVLEKIGGHVYLSELLDSSLSAANVAHYARIVKEKAVARAVVEAARQIIQRANNQNGNGADSLIAFAQKEILSVSVNGAGTGGMEIREVIKRTFAALEARHERGNTLPGASTGFPGLDALTGGLKPGCLYIIAGRPGTGKTAMALNISWTIARSGERVGFYSLEMPNGELSQRLLSTATGIDSHKLTRCFLSTGQWQTIAGTADALARLPMVIDDTGGLPIDRLMARARRIKAEGGLALIVVDYLQLVRPSQKWGTREQEVAEVSRCLKVIAKELSVPVLACAQLNRAVEARHDKRPTLADLRESGSIEQDADVIAFLKEAEDDGYTELAILKNRQGPTGKVALVFDKALTKFMEPRRGDNAGVTERKDIDD